ncbi:MAG TPA: adenylate/guanylate cyclase domain-containing protein [Longimicrobiales bacterium]|nr:adenylate/guanylate cyclase domain-containing protein [Longimicrobiales bacterium]
MSKHWVRISAGIFVVLLALAHVADRLRVPFIDNLDSIIYDARLRLTMPRTADNRIVILDVNEKSLLERERGGEGRWPWPRDRLALLLEKLFNQYQVAVVGFDFVFSERDESSGIRVLERLGEQELKAVPEFQTALHRMKPQLDYDETFARGMKGRAVVLGYAFVDDRANKGTLPQPVLTRASFGQQRPRLVSFPGYTANLPVLQGNAAAAGHFNPLTDDDGVTRRVPMLVEYAGNYYEPLSLAMMRLMYGSPPVTPVVGAADVAPGYAAVQELRVGSYRIPIDVDGAVLVPYRGPKGSFAYYPLVDALNDRLDVSQLKGKIVLVGATAPGMFDLRATPVDPVLPGVEIHANLLAGIMDNSIKHKPPYAAGAEFSMVLLVGLALALWLPILTPQRATAVVLAAVLCILGINLSLFEYANLVLPLASVLATVMLLFILNMAYGFFVEARGRQQITGLFGQYVPPEVVDEIAKNPKSFSMEGESREMTVLFADVRGFTSIAEGLEAKVLSRLMNEFLTPLTEVIYKHRGTVDKYMGDCIMAFWGAPVADPHHARNALRAALEMQRTIKSIRRTANADPEIRIGIGLNTGRMSVGNMGSRVRLAYTVMGDAVNLASRLEGITKEYGSDIVVSEEVKHAVPDIAFRELDRVRVKGRDAAVTIYEPLGILGELPPEILEQAEVFGRGLELYRRQEWGQAEQQFEELDRRSPGVRLHQVFLERIAYLRLHPPGVTWDGTFTFQIK